MSSTTHRSPADYFAARVRDAKPSPTLAVSEKARQLKAQGIDVIDLGGGDPDFITPLHIREAAIAAMNAGDTHYVGGAGTPAFRKAIAEKLARENGIEVDPNKEIFVTPGGKFSMYLAAQAFVEPGVDVMILDPSWVSYGPMVELAGGTAVSVPLDANNNFAITRDLLEEYRTPNTRVILLNSPNNPTGRVMTEAEAEAIVGFANDYDLMVWTDEMYEKIIFDGRQHISLATYDGMKSRTLTFNGLSKAFAMTGWRLGYVAGPAEYIAQISVVNSHSLTCATSFAQAGGAAALSGPQDQITEMVNAWDRRRHLVANGLNKIKGLKTGLVEGAFYAFVDAREVSNDSVAFCDQILREANVAVVPGVAFGAAGEGHFRLSFATSDELLTSVIERLSAMLGTR